MALNQRCSFFIGESPGTLQIDSSVSPGTLQIDTSVRLEKAWLDSSPVGCVKTVAK